MGIENLAPRPDPQAIEAAQAKRDHEDWVRFAGAALTGLLANPQSAIRHSPDGLVMEASRTADRMMELMKTLER
jgi:hypothetical protein